MPLLSFGQPKPACNKGNLVYHKYICLCYTEAEHKTNWSSQILTKHMVENSVVQRYSSFRKDPLTKTCPSNDDYVHTHYDKGHLCNAKDNRFDTLAEKESFYLPNTVPQDPNFNRGIWGALEENVRDTVSKYDSTYTVSGAIYVDSIKYIGTSKVPVPSHMWKVIYVYKTKQTYCWLFGNHPYHDGEVPNDYLSTMEAIISTSKNSLIFIK